MPFLRAALIKKNKHEPELIPEKVPVIAEPEIEEPENIDEIDVDVESLHKLIDEKVDELDESDESDQIEQEEPEQEIPEGLAAVVDLPVEDEPEESESAALPPEILEAITEEPVTEIESPESESEPEPEPEQEPDTEEKEPSPEEEPAPEEFTLMYDVTSGERYVDKVSTKTEFDKVLDSLADISKDLLSWEVEKFAKKYTGKFQGDFDKTEADAKKYEAFLGGYITNAAMTLYDNGYKDAAVKRLEQAKSILEARRKLEDETQAIRDRVEEEDAAVDLSDILGLFGDG